MTRRLGARPDSHGTRSSSPARKQRRNPVAGLEAFDLEDRAGWERAIRDVGGLHVAREDRPDFAEVPGYLKGYRKGIAPDELAQMVAEERGLRARDVERAMLRAFHGPRRRPAAEPDYEALEREAIEREPRTGESRPRVTVAGDTFKLRPRSPFKGRVSRVNARRPNPAPDDVRIVARIPGYVDSISLAGSRAPYTHPLLRASKMYGRADGSVIIRPPAGRKLWRARP